MDFGIAPPQRAGCYRLSTKSWELHYSGTTSVPASSQASFQNHTYTNTTGQALDVFISVRNTGLGLIEPFEITIQATGLPSPPLTLYLDADPSTPFNVSNPLSDVNTYVPGARLSDGASVPLPQRVHIYAAYTDLAGKIIAPPASGAVSFTLSNTSAFDGMAMNALNPVSWSRLDTDPDFGPPSAGVPFGSTHVARFDVDCWDYGGFTDVNAVHWTVQAQMRLPKDSANNNWLPDGGWAAGSATVQDDVQNQWEDVDNVPVVQPPPSTGLIGDGLTRFEEYRGFIVRGLHRRTNPAKKDLFAAGAISWMSSVIGLGYTLNLPVDVHHVYGEEDQGVPLEYKAADPNQPQLYRAINFNVNNNSQTGQLQGHTDQKAILVRVGTIAQPTVLGNTAYLQYPPTYCPPSGGGTPNELPDITIDLAEHQTFGQANNNTQLEINNEIRRTVGHEVGHALHVIHRGDTQVCTDGATVGTSTSIMSTGWENGPVSTDPRSQYNTNDIAQIRLH